MTRRGLSLFQIEAASRKQIFERGMLLALLPLMPLALLGLSIHLPQIFFPSWNPTSTVPWREDSVGANIGILIYGVGGLFLEVVAMRNLGKSVRGFNLVSVLSVPMIFFAILWFCATFYLTVLGAVGLIYPGQRIMPP
jgi:hypothetical protein